MTIRGIIEDYTFLPETRGGVVCRGILNGMTWTTTTVKKFNVADRQIETSSGSIYQLGVVKPGVWIIQLQMRRPVIFAKLEALTH